MLDTGARDPKRRTRHRGEPDQRADLDVIRLNGVTRTAQRCRPVYDDGVGADTLDLGAERDQEMREVLHMRLGGGIAQVSGAVGSNRCDQRVFGSRHAGLVEEDVGALQPSGTEFQPVGRGDGGA